MANKNKLVWGKLFMTEMEYRLKKLRENLKVFINKNIAIYGTGDNAREILNNFPDLRISALIDDRYTGEYVYGKKIISLEELQLLRIKTIIIAAEANSEYIVFNRIRSFCINNDIQLYNMYGFDILKLYNNILAKELNYTECCEEDLKRKINKHDLLCVQLVDVLCAHTRYDQELFLKATEDECSSVHKRSCELLCAREENAVIKNMIPKRRLIEILQWAIGEGKEIYIISDLKISLTAIQKFLKNLGINKCKAVVQENVVNLTLSNGALRECLGQDLNKKVLYIGTNDKNNLIIPQLYGMDIYLLKSAWDLAWQFSKYFERKKKYSDDARRDDIAAYIQYRFDSPFLTDNNFSIEKMHAVSNLRWELENNHEYLPELFSVEEDKTIRDVETLNFPKYDEPLVSVIIPAYNQFIYTYNCLNSILKNTKNVPYEIILADDNSTDDTRIIETVINGIQVLHNEKNLLFLRNCNGATKYAKGKYLLFLNNDTQVRFNWMFPLVALMEKHEDIGLIGSKLLYPNGKIQEAGGIIWKDGSAFNYGRNMDATGLRYNYVREVDYLTGASIMISKALWQEIGGFDERYVPAYCEDSDLAFEVRKHHKKVVYQPASEVIHFEGISHGKDVKTGIRAYQNLNVEKLRLKWKDILEKENHIPDKNILPICDRKEDRKLIIFVITGCDSCEQAFDLKENITLIKDTLKKGYLVKTWVINTKISEADIFVLQQLGVEVFLERKYKNIFDEWIFENREEIDYVVFRGSRYISDLIRVLKCTHIKFYVSRCF